nr:hypothetical protein [Marivita geojedonensis]
MRVTIGHDVWIGHEVTIGTGAVIGAGQLRHAMLRPIRLWEAFPRVPSNKRRFTEAQAEALLEIAVWDWPRETYKAALPDIRALDIDAFIEEYRR